MADLITNNATLLEARKRFIQTVKRYDLVANGDLAANVDNGANRYLQEATTWLDLNVRHQYEQRREVRTLNEGDFGISIGDLIRLDNAALVNGDTRIDITELYRPYKEFQQFMNIPYADWETGETEVWTIIPHVLAPPVTRRGLPLVAAKDAFNSTDQTFSRRLNVFHNHILNGDFHSLNFWTLGTGWAITSGALTGTAVAVGDAAYYAQPGNPTQNNTMSGYKIKPNTTYRVRCTVTGTGTVQIKVGDAVVAAGQGAGSVDVTLTTAGEFNTDTEDGENFRVEAATTFTGTIDNIIINEVDNESARLTFIQLLIYPPVDADYTIEVVGVFYSELLSEDGQTSIWTRYYTDLLVNKAAELYYVGMGNSERARLFAVACQNWINGIDDRLVEHDLIGNTGQMERWNYT